MRTLLLSFVAATSLIVAAQVWGQTPGAKGDQQRSYYFTEAGQETPYRLYVPQSYDAEVGAPLVVALHGYGGDQNTFFQAVPDLPAVPTNNSSGLILLSFSKMWG